MPDAVITDIDNSDIIWKNFQFSDELLTLAGADVIAEGTILARDTSTLKLVLFAKGGVTNGNGIPNSILTYTDSIGGAGDLAIRAGISGTYRTDRLIIDADGDNSNVDKAVIDQLRDFGLVEQVVVELNELDNR